MYIYERMYCTTTVVLDIFVRLIKQAVGWLCVDKAIRSDINMYTDD